MEKAKNAISSLLSGSNQAAWIDGKDAKLRVDKADMPVPGADEVVVKNHAVAVNPVDWKIQDYGIFVTNWPAVLGNDVAGEVVEVGSSVTRFKKGDRVLAHALGLTTNKPTNGGFALYTAVPSSRTAPIPSGTSYAEASVLPLALSTAAAGLYAPAADGFLGLGAPAVPPAARSGQTLVVWGGASSVGPAVVQLAVASGANVVATASPHNHALVAGWGAAAVLDYRAASVVDDVAAAVRAAGGEFVGVYDAISTADGSYPLVLPLLDKLGGGSLAVVGYPPKDDAGVPASVRVGGVFAAAPLKSNVWEDFVGPALQAGVLKCVPEPLVIGKGLEKVQEGLDANKKGVSAKKVVIEL